MKKILMLAALALPLSMALTSCNSGTTSAGTLPNYNNIRVGVNDSNSAITATRAETTTPAVPATATTPAIPAITKVSWSIGTSTPATFTFNAVAGSDAATITGYRIISDSVNRLSTTTVKSINIYVPSGYYCTNQDSLASHQQSCDPNDASTKPATGIPSAILSLDLASDLVPLIESKGATVTRSVDIEFTGVSARNEPITIVSKGVVATGFFAGTQP